MNDPSPSPRIAPTVGRIVLYFADPNEGIATIDPLAAVVAKVNKDGTLNLGVFDSHGRTHARASVTLVQPGEPKPEGAFAAWMPFQIGQAVKTASLEAALAARDTANNQQQSAAANQAQADQPSAPAADAEASQTND